MGAEVLLDVHTHTLASGHAYGTIREMAKRRKGKGLHCWESANTLPGYRGQQIQFIIII